MSNILADFFNPAAPVVNAYENNTTANEFRPSPKKGQNGVYEAVIRFLPNPADPANKSMIQKFSVYITDPATGQKRVLDDPRSIGQQSIIAQTFFALRGSNNPVLQEASKQFSSKLNVYSLIQVLNCKSDPSLEGKILVWRYGQKILEKIQAELNPPMGQSRNPFNLIIGRPFSLKVKEVSGFPNYDGCSFFDLALNQGGFRIQVPDQMGQLQWMVTTEETISSEQGRNVVFEYLKNNAPDMSAYEYKPWSQDDQDFINRMVQFYSNPQSIVQRQAQQMAPAPNVPGMGQQTNGGFMPGMQMPNVGAPVPPSAGMGQSLPGVPQIPGMQMPNVPQMPAAPQMNQSMNFNGGVPASDPTTTGVNVSDQLPGDLASLIGTPAPSVPQTGIPSTGLNLEDVLAGQILPG